MEGAETPKPTVSVEDAARVVVDDCTGYISKKIHEFASAVQRSSMPIPLEPLPASVAHPLVRASPSFTIVCCGFGFRDAAATALEKTVKEQERKIDALNSEKEKLTATLTEHKKALLTMKFNVCLAPEVNCNNFTSLTRTFRFPT
mgnify:CR=1 FL=1